MHATSQIRGVSGKEFATKITLIMRSHDNPGGLDQTCQNSIRAFVAFPSRTGVAYVQQTETSSTGLHDEKIQHNSVLSQPQVVSQPNEIAIAANDSSYRMTLPSHMLRFLPSQGMP
jgi:hypothetical protein